MRWLQVSRKALSNPSRRASVLWTTITRYCRNPRFPFAISQIEILVVFLELAEDLRLTVTVIAELRDARPPENNRRPCRDLPDRRRRRVRLGGRCA